MMRTSVVSALVVAAGLATAASAQTVTYSWSGPTTVNPGETHTYTLSAEYSLPAGDEDHYAGGQFAVDVSGANGESFSADESAGLGRAAPWQNFPAGPVLDFDQLGPIVGDASLGSTFSSGLWDHAQIPEILGGAPDMSNPAAFFTMDVTFGDGGVVTFATNTASAVIGQAPLGLPVDATTVNEGSISVTVVPAPASLALLGLGGLASIRRRR